MDLSGPYRVLALSVIAQAVYDGDAAWLAGLIDRRTLLLWCDMANVDFEDLQRDCVRCRTWRPRRRSIRAHNARLLHLEAR